MSRGAGEAEILLIEDNPGDIRLVEESFSEFHLRNTLHVVTDGEAALDFIYRRGPYADAPRPDIVLLDLNLPKVDGEDVLHAIKEESDLGDVPVIVLTGVDETLIESRDLDHDADEDGVLTKPVDPLALIQEIKGFDRIEFAVMRTG